jgi:hypothetical protein
MQEESFLKMGLNLNLSFLKESHEAENLKDLDYLSSTVCLTILDQGSKMITFE